MYGLTCCFANFGAYMLWHPYKDPLDNRLALLCQVQIFFILLLTVALRYDEVVTVSEGEVRRGGPSARLVGSK